MSKRILKIISKIRNSFVGAEVVYTQGSCFKFYEILKAIYPDAEPYYIDKHIITKIGEKFYDITGEVAGKNAIHIKQADKYIVERIKINTFGVGFYECPNCYEHIKIY